MTKIIPLVAQLGSSKSGLTIGYTIYRLDHTVFSPFSTTGVVESVIPGTYFVNEGITVPDEGSYILVGTSTQPLIMVDSETSFSNEDALRLLELHRFRHLDPSNPITTDKNSNTTTETDGDIVITHVLNPSTETITSTRTG